MDSRIVDSIKGLEYGDQMMRHSGETVQSLGSDLFVTPSATPPFNRNLRNLCNLRIFISVFRRSLLSASICVHLRLGFDQGHIKYFVDGADRMELKALFGFWGDLFEVFLVGFGEQHDVNAGAQGSQTLFF
jgi:hypothetical protein